MGLKKYIQVIWKEYMQMENSKYKIKMNRYPENIILEAWEKAEKTQKTVLMQQIRFFY